MYGGMAYERDELPDLLGNSSLLLRAPIMKGHMCKSE